MAPGSSTSRRGGSESLPSGDGRAAPARAQSLKRHNLALVLGDVAAHEGPTRAQIATRTGLTKATVSSLVDALVASGLVVEQDPARGLVGRPASPLALNRAGPAGLGVEICVDHVYACVVDLTGTLRFEQSLGGDNRLRAPEEVMREARATAEAVVTDAAAVGLAVAGLGVGVPGLVDRAGVLRRAPNLSSLEGRAVATEIAGGLSFAVGSVICDNEANLAALAELWSGGAASRRDFVRVSGEIGVGAGIVIGGELWRGVRNMSGELGHVTVEPDGRPCSCGSRGCLEQIAGLEALLRDSGITTFAGGGASASGNDSGGGPGSGSGAGIGTSELARRAAAGDELVRATLERAGGALGRALAALVNLVDVPTVVLGGLYAELWPWLEEPIRRELAQRVVGHVWSPTELLVTNVGEHVAAYGAASAVVRAILADPVVLCPSR